MAVQNLLLAAHALGLGSCVLTAPLIVQEAVLGALNLARGSRPHLPGGAGLPRRNAAAAPEEKYRTNRGIQEGWRQTGKQMMTENEIFERLKPLLVEVLGVAPEKIRSESVLVADLGAESIDLLDLSFRIEETFHVTIEANEIEREASKRLPGGVYEKDGWLTEEALAEIRKSVAGTGCEQARHRACGRWTCRRC